MNSVDLISCLNKTDDSAEIIKLLNDLKISKKPKIKKGETDVIVDVLSAGLALVFEGVDDPKSSALVLVEIQLYAGAGGKFTRFSGELPKGICFTDTSKEAREKLGKPTRINKDLNKDIWDSKEFRISASYAKANGPIVMMRLGIPQG